MLRKVVKGVVHCDVLAEPPIEKGFEGPYDVVIESGCLLAACTTTESFKKGLVTLSHLLKPGGTIIMWGSDRSMEQPTIVYTVGDKEYISLRAEKEFVVDAMKEAGFSSVHMQFCEVDCSSGSKYETDNMGLRGYYVINAKRSSS